MTTTNNVGKVVQIIGPVIDVEFTTETVPAIYNALHVEFSAMGQPVKLTLEVQQHLGEGWVRAIAMSSCEGLKRGMPVIATGNSISVPVGDCILGQLKLKTGERE